MLPIKLALIVVYRQKELACCKYKHINVATLIFLFTNHKSEKSSSAPFSAVLYTLAKQAKELNYKKLNLQVNNRIQKLRVPTTLQEQVDVCPSINSF